MPTVSSNTLSDVTSVVFYYVSLYVDSRGVYALWPPRQCPLIVLACVLFTKLGSCLGTDLKDDYA